MPCTCACHEAEENHDMEDCYCMRERKQVPCPDCRFTTDDESEFEEHYYFEHGAGSYHGEVIVKSEGVELFRVG